ncbi:flavin reductase family protein [Streptomyces sioyaensis]|uniref:Flavin reductase n=1 Tax=Streptomyces sioyaensis TaxID=67364 RepID=A0A4Q1QST3_9ACTN|nr:flavin reductase family protein [Streptomyces sioyaensis]MBM4791285.1 flavin reductase family protein [Streptomyces sioyaensis]RXS65195.1 flavin reductase [Streptomyces sioyaensis]
MTAALTKELDSRQLRQAFSCFPTGVTALCGLVDGEPTGMAVSSFTSVSLTPPLVSVCIQDTSTTWSKLRDRRLGLSVLAEDQDTACRRLSSKDGDRFGDLQWQATDEGRLIIDGAVAWFDCSLFTEIPAGDHTIAVLQIHDLWTSPNTAPLVFHGSRFRRLAPTDQVQ